jgi:hypothetical protein
MTTSTAFTTSTGARGRTRTVRRFAVVARRNAEVLYRTDDLARARRRADAATNTTGLRHSVAGGADVIDAHTGEILDRRRPLPLGHDWGDREERAALAARWAELS